MTRNEALAAIFVFGAALGAIGLLVILLRVRAPFLRRDNNSLIAILTDGLIALVGAILTVDLISFLRTFEFVTSPAGLVISRFVILLTVFLGVWVGLIRFLIWIMWGDRTEPDRLADSVSIRDEVLRLRLLLDSYLAHIDREDARRERGGTSP